MARKPAVTKKPAARVAKGKRRGPGELVADLKAKREKLAQTLSARIAQIDERIAELETKHQARIAIDNLAKTKTPEELLREEAELKTKLSLLKKARKLTAK